MKLMPWDQKVLTCAASSQEGRAPWPKLTRRVSSLHHGILPRTNRLVLTSSRSVQVSKRGLPLVQTRNSTSSQIVAA